MSDLFSPLAIRGVTLSNRIVVAPMGQHASNNGYADDWHLVHLGSRAVGGAGVVMVESTAVTTQGRMGPLDLGIWSDDHVDYLARIVAFIQSQGSIAAIQLNHAGRKASSFLPGRKVATIGEADGGWIPVGPSAVPYGDGFVTPTVLGVPGVAAIKAAFAEAACRALEADFRILEINAGQGFLLHQFLSPLSNLRKDEYGGDFTGRTRFVCELIESVRVAWPERLPLWVRINADDGHESGWDIEQSIALAGKLEALGVDLLVGASGSVIPRPANVIDAQYQWEFSARLRRETGVMAGAAGMIKSPRDAEAIIREGQADIVVLAREFLQDPYWPLHAAAELGQTVAWPLQYLAAAPRNTPARG